MEVEVQNVLRTSSWEGSWENVGLGRGRGQLKWVAQQGPLEENCSSQLPPIRPS